MQIDKNPPQAVELEQAVLGACMLEEDSVIKCLDILQPDDFYKEEHQKIYQAITEMFKDAQAIDLLTITERLRKKGELEMCGGAFYITELSAQVASSAHLDDHIKILQEKSISRTMIQSCSLIVKECYDQTRDVFDVVDEAQSMIGTALNKLTEDREIVLKDVMAEIYHKIRSGESTKGIETGIDFIDNDLHGLHKGNMVVIAARPGMGKTAFALQLSSNLMERGHSIGFISLEMNETELGQRILSQNSGVSFESIRLNTVKKQDLQVLEIALRKIETWSMNIRDVTAGMAGIRAMAKKWKIQNGISALFIDYLQLMDAKGETREQAVASISRGIKLLAKELQIPVVILAQLNRKCEERPNKIPRLSDLRESGAIEQDADSVIFLHRPEVYGLELESLDVDVIVPSPQSVDQLCISIIPKNRHGKPNLFRAVRFDGSTQQFSNYHPETPQGFTPVSELEDSPF